MTLETLLWRLTLMRRGWLILAVLCGLTYLILVPFYLYTAWVEYVMAATGVATRTGVNSWLVQVVAHSAGRLEVLSIAFRVLGACFWLAWLWYAVCFAIRLSPDAPPRYGPWISVLCWFVPVVQYILPQVVMIDIARITVRDDRSPPDEGDGETLPNLDSRDLYWLTPAILVCNLVSLGLMKVIGEAMSGGLTFSTHGQHILHLASAAGVVGLLLLLCVDAYMRTVAKAQETRAARLFLDGPPSGLPADSL